VHQVVVDAVAHRHFGHRRTRRVALRHHLRLELGAVVAPLDEFVSCLCVHDVPFVDTIVALARYALKVGLAARLVRQETVGE
jgi:hypothetical protein